MLYLIEKGTFVKGERKHSSDLLHVFLTWDENGCFGGFSYWFREFGVQTLKLRLFIQLEGSKKQKPH